MGLCSASVFVLSDIYIAIIVLRHFEIVKMPDWHQWLMPVILSTEEAEIRRISV
jgi:hypothetical protein